MLHTFGSTRFSSWYYRAALITVLLLGSLASVYTYQQTTRQHQQSLLENASALAYAIDPQELTSLTGSSADFTNPTYNALKVRLQKARGARPDVRFIYLTGYRDGEPFFYIDSEPDTSEDYSPPGQIFYEGSEAFREPLLHNNPAPRLDAIYADRWGTWLTAVVPITNPDTGTVTALMGVDVDASEYYRTAWVYTSAPIGVTLFVLILLTIGYAVRRREQRLLDFKSELVSVASHEIRTPLNSISWLAEQVQQKPALPESVKNDLRLIASQSRELLLSVNNLLDLTMLEESLSTQQSVASNPARALIQAVVDSFSVTLSEKSLSIVVEPSISTQATVAGDPARLKRLFANLISNAIKHSKPGSTITIGGSAGSRRVTFSVSDERIGLFTAPTKTERETDLGLRYVQQVAHLYGGRVWVESAPSKGTTFYVELPV